MSVITIKSNFNKKVSLYLLPPLFLSLAQAILN